MRRHVVACLVGVLAMTTLTGCLDVVVLTEAENGQDVTLSQSSLLVVMLESNATTGYAWELTELDTAVLENTSQQYLPSPLPLVGAGGLEVWNFAPVGPGNTALQLDYRQPWDSTSEPADTFEVAVTVE